jgi:cell division transport system permease protein
MAQFGKASAKRSKPSYVNTIVGIALVLFLFGLVGWLFFNLKKFGEVVRERNIQVHAWIAPSAKKSQVDTLQHYIASLPYIINSEYVTKEEAIKKYESEQGDTTWKEFIGNNPLPESIDFYVKAEYMNADSLDALSTFLDTNFPNTISEFKYPKAIVRSIGTFTTYFTVALFAFAIIFSIIVIISIDNTIRLAMYSNRFLIKTMQMVGATRGFIVKPLNIRALINGLIAASIAILVLFGFIWLAESYIADLKLLRDSKNTLMIIGGMLALGVLISFLSTHRSVIKYLQMKLDDLY